MECLKSRNFGLVKGHKRQTGNKTIDRQDTKRQTGHKTTDRQDTKQPLQNCIHVL